MSLVTPLKGGRTLLVRSIPLVGHACHSFGKTSLSPGAKKSPPDRSGGPIFRDGLAAYFFCSLQASAMGAWAQGRALTRVSVGSLEYSSTRLGPLAQATSM